MTPFSADPGDAPAWYVDIETIAWRSEPPLRAHPLRRKAVLGRPKPVGRHP